MKNQKFYAVINRGKGIVKESKSATPGTRIRIKGFKHKETMAYIESVYDEIDDFHVDFPDKSPMKFVDDEQWDLFQKELKVKVEEDLKTFQIFSSGNDPWLLIAHKDMADEVADVSKLNHQAKERIFTDATEEPIVNVLTKKTVGVIRKIFENKFDWKDQQLRDITVGDLLKISRNDILETRGAGQKVVIEIELYLSMRGIIELPEQDD